VFIDEVDSLGGQRRDTEEESTRRIKTELLVQMDGLKGNGVLVLGATNTPWTLDAGLRRRFERRIYIPLPDEGARLCMIQNGLAAVTHTLTGDDVKKLAEASEGLSAADVGTMLNQAVRKPLLALQAAQYFEAVDDKLIPRGQEPQCPQW